MCPLPFVAVEKVDKFPANCVQKADDMQGSKIRFYISVILCN